jgi:hypothetical protein
MVLVPDADGSLKPPQAVQASWKRAIEGWMHYLYGDPSAGMR